MKDGFLKVAAITPDVRVADVPYNIASIISHMQKEREAGTKIALFPELCITGYTCQDLLLQDILLKEAKEGLHQIMQASIGSDMLVFVGLPFVYREKLYNICACIQDGKLLGLVPKTHIPNYREFYEARYFERYSESPVEIPVFGKMTFFGTRILFRCQTMSDVLIGAEICEDVWAAVPPSTAHALAGATILVNLSASNALVGKDSYRKSLIANQSARLIAAYLYANAGEGESSGDLVFGGHNLIAENGQILVESRPFVNESIRTEIDVNRLSLDRRNITTFKSENTQIYTYVNFNFQIEKTELSRVFEPSPFVPLKESEKQDRCEEILSIQALGLKKRIAHTGVKNIVLGISGGLDSTLALLVCVRAFDMLGLSRSGIHAITMPGFGTTDRTYTNACTLTKKIGASLEEISIVEAVAGHLKDIGHAIEKKDVTYENAQARERTQILMDIANRDQALVVGTGDLSELVLGWATYNGDHMSMYGVNASVPKTLIRHLVSYYAKVEMDEEISEILLDILQTPVSPELLPPTDGQISQKTEDLVGPYELHDFFLYYVLRFGFSPSKVYRLATCAFDSIYDANTIYKWLYTFYRRFFSQQFKRSCLPDGPKVGSVAVSPRGDLRMPSDAMATIWLKDLERVKV